MTNTRLPGLDFAAELDESLEVLRANDPSDRPYYGLFSGGKDSVVIHELARMADVKVEWHYNVTTIDPPELVRFIRREYPHVKFLPPKYGNFFRRAAEVKGFPTRRARWCCDEYKESGNPSGETLLCGIRAQESPRRAKNWSQVEWHRRKGALMVNPIFLWESSDLWDFIRGSSLPCCRLYDEGFHRLGCVGCPMATRQSRAKEFRRWPRYERRWRYVIDRTWQRRAGTMQTGGREWFGSALFNNSGALWDWWVGGGSLPKTDEAQQVLTT